MNAEKIFKDILMMLSDIYQNEGSKNGSLTAEALSLAGNQQLTLKKMKMMSFQNSLIHLYLMTTICLHIS